jgi:hypothetical protein
MGFNEVMALHGQMPVKAVAGSEPMPFQKYEKTRSGLLAGFFHVLWKHLPPGGSTCLPTEA